MKSKKKKRKIIFTALICAGIISLGSFATIAYAADNTAESGNNDLMQSVRQTVQSTFKNVSEQAKTLINNLRGIKSNGFGFAFCNPEEAASILGITEEELMTKLEETDGNIIKILEDAGKLDEYKIKILAEYKNKLDIAVAEGSLTQDKANEKYAQAETIINEIDSESMPNIGVHKFSDGEIPEEFKKFKDGEFDGFEGLDRFMEKHEGFGSGFGISFGIIDGVKIFFSSDDVNIADMLGISEEELKIKIEENSGNIFKVLEDAGKLEEYKIKILENFKSKLDQQVAEGKITQDKADEIYGSMAEFTADFNSEYVNSERTMPEFEGKRGPRTRSWNGSDGKESRTVIPESNSEENSL